MFKFLDLFSGIGGFRRGMELAGGKCVGYCEIDKWSRVTYNAIHNTKGEWSCEDIRTADPIRMPEADCWCFGFPCQDNTILSKTLGPERLGTRKGTRSGLYFNVLELAGVKKPKYLFAENVEGLFSVNNGSDFAEVIGAMDEMGYICEWQVCNSRHLLPQNRPRVYIIGHSREAEFTPVFPIPEIAEIPRKASSAKEDKAYVNCLLARKGGPSIDETYICEPGIGPRRPSPRELFKLQGFTGADADKARAAGVPVGELRKQAGNSVSVSVIEVIAKNLVAIEEGRIA